MSPDHAEEEGADRIDDAIPSSGYQLLPMVGLGGSAGAIQALQAFFKAVPPNPGMAFVVVLHLSPDYESTLPQVLQRATAMPVRQASASQVVEADTVYVIPPGKSIEALDGRLVLRDASPLVGGRHVAVDLFLRTLADTHGPHAAAVVLSGADGDGAIGIKRIKERGGLTVCQDPQEAEHASMPRTAIDTGMVDWVLPVAEMPARLMQYFGIEKQLQLPPEDVPGPAAAGAGQGADSESQLRDVLALLRSRTGRDFSVYKRATVLRRIARRMQVNAVHDLGAYLDCLRTRHGEANALLQDLLISVTNFFRDAECFAALEAEIAQMFRGKGPGDTIRVWVPACATGEEAYSIAMILAEKARELDAPPVLQVFGTDLDEQAIRAAREGVYPLTIEADVSEDRLRRFFVRELHGYHVRRELRELVLFAQHDLLKDAPFSRLDLVSCRNLLIYLSREAQQRVFDTLHFALVPGGRLFLGSSESAEEAAAQFAVIDKKHRIYMTRAATRMLLPVPATPDGRGVALALQHRAPRVPVVATAALDWGSNVTGARLPARSVSWGELHLKLLEAIAPPSVLVDAEQVILHLSASAGRVMQFGGGEPSTNLLRVVHPQLRVELRAALLQAIESGERTETEVGPLAIEGKDVDVTMRVVPAREVGEALYLVTFTMSPHGERQVVRASDEARPDAEPAARQLERELERVKGQLRETVEQYEASTEELKANNEELQAMNEELRSATEELETSREELQSINEELITVNHELKGKVDELALANSDMHNLMNATEIATVFLDRDLCITRYTPAAISLFNLIATDVGRPLADLATRLEYPQLSADAHGVLARLVPVQREVGLPDGRWFLARLLPYRTMEDRIAGVVLSFIDITERKQAEEVRLWLSAVVASSTDAIISFSTDQIILSWNTGAERMFGYTAAEAIGQPLALVAWPGAASQELFARLREPQPVSNLEAVARCKDQRQLSVALSVAPIRNAEEPVIGATAIARDITESKRAAEALRESEERLRLLVENATEFAIFSTDLQRRVTIWNSGAERLLGYAEAEVIGQSADVIFTDEDRAAGAPEQEMRTAVAHERAADERWHKRKDGSRFWGSGAMMLMRDADGRPVGFVKVLRDQTPAREAQLALERSQTDLLRVLAENEASRAELQSADAAKDRFLAVLSHELRNPLASIDSAAALLRAPSIPQKDRDEEADVVKRQAGAMKSLLDELLDVSRLKLGRLELQRAPVALKAVVDSELESTRSMLQAAGHKLEVRMPEEDIVLDADALRLSQVLSNLVTNAVKYTPAGGTITVSAGVDGGEVVLGVKDTGAGIDPAQIDRIFEMFAQGQSGPDHSHGLGIGLALVKNIVELHGGRVTAASAGLGRGSEFQVRLPAGIATIRPPRATPAPSPAAAVEEPARRAHKRGLILIADDNLDAAWGISRLLEIAGFATLRVSGGVEAVQATRKHKPDVGIIDIGMPDLDGHEVARQIRQTEWGKHMVLIAATGWGQESDQSAAIDAGFDAHMTKPVNLRKLSGVVDDLLARKRR
jgi:two-component system, chemotaxis family, CheB/CheR fusion protein